MIYFFQYDLDGVFLLHRAASVKNLRSEGGNLQPPDALRSFLPDFGRIEAVKHSRMKKSNRKFSG